MEDKSPNQTWINYNLFGSLESQQRNYAKRNPTPEQLAQLECSKPRVRFKEYIIVIKLGWRRYNDGHWKCEHCGRLSHIWGLHETTVHNKGLSFNWTKCPACGFKGDLTVTNELGLVEMPKRIIDREINHKDRSML
jgi:hypothetical protein